MDYLNSNNNPINNLQGFNRLTGSAIWTAERKDSFRNSLSLTLRTNLDGVRKDRENIPEIQSKIEKKDYAITLSNRSQWQLNRRWIDRISLQGGFSYSYTEDYNASWLNTGGLIVPTAPPVRDQYDQCHARHHCRSGAAHSFCCESSE